MEQTFIMIKPDGVQRGLVGQIITRFEQKGYFLRGIKMLVASEGLLQEHYQDLAQKGFFAGLITYMHSGPVCAMIWEGKNVVKAGRTLLGATNPQDSAPGTIRGDFCVEVGRNVCHGSDSAEAAKREISLWFKEEEQVNNWTHTAKQWIYE